MKTKNIREKHVTRNSDVMNAEIGYVRDELNGIITPATIKEGVNGIGRILKRKEVLRIVGLSSAQMYRNIRSGLFPPPYLLGRKGVGWKESDIVAWMDGLRPANTIRNPQQKRHS